jgi:hypothetical protein
VLTLTLVWVIVLVLVLVLMLVTAPLDDERVVNNPPIGHISVPLLLVIQEVTVDVVKTVVVPGVVVANAGTELDVFGLLPPSGQPMTTGNDGRSSILTPDEPMPTPTGRVTETLTLKIGPTTRLPSRPMQRAMMLPPQVGYGMPPDIVGVTGTDGSGTDDDGVKVVAGSAEDGVSPGNSEDETPPPMGGAT